LGTWRTIQDTATLTHTSIFTVSRWIVRRLVRGQATMIAQRNSTLLATAVRDAEGSDQYPCWVLPPTDSLPGKAAHVAGLYRAQARSRSLEDGRPVVSPLLSQPIVEAALGVPTWRWCEGGIDRALVRQAFREQLPASVVQRRWKGGADGFCLAFISAHRAELRSRLLDGNLARAGLLDRDAVEAALSDAGLLRGKNYASIMELTEAEGWAQYWVDQQTVVDRSLPASPSRRANAPDPMPS
jgi:asparagine synthase (glutamine-hydrolysing)